MHSRLVANREVNVVVAYGIGRIVLFLVTQGNQEAVGHKLDVLAHELGVHSNQSNRESIGQKLLFDRNCLNDDASDGVRVRALAQVGEEQARKIGVHAFVTRNQLVGEGQAGHQSTLLHPEN